MAGAGRARRLLAEAVSFLEQLLSDSPSESPRQAMEYRVGPIVSLQRRMIPRCEPARRVSAEIRLGQPCAAACGCDLLNQSDLWFQLVKIGTPSVWLAS